jgi:hypothetical protein
MTAAYSIWGFPFTPYTGGTHCWRARAWDEQPMKIDGEAALYGDWSNCCCFEVLQPDFTFSPSSPEIGETVVFGIEGIPDAIDRATWNLGGTGCDSATATQVCTSSLNNDCKALAFEYDSAGTKTVNLSIEIGGITYTAPQKMISVQNTGQCGGQVCQDLATPTITGVGDTTCGGTTSQTSPNLTWGDVANESGYTWEVRNSFGTVVNSGTAHANTRTVNVGSLDPGSFVARVQAFGDGVDFCSSQWSSSCVFEVIGPCTTLAAPTVTGVGGATCGGTTADTTPTLRWDDVNYDEGYRWQVRDTAGVIIDSGITGNNRTFDMVGELEPGAYSARVQALGDGQDYCDSEWSASCSFAVEAVSVDFAWWPEQPKQGERVRFADLSSGGSRSWHWDFGDGWTSDKQHPTHVFASTGSFTTLLDVEFDSGHLIEEKTVTVLGTDGHGIGHSAVWRRRMRGERNRVVLSRGLCFGARGDGPRRRQRSPSDRARGGGRGCRDRWHPVEDGGHNSQLGTRSGHIDR